MIKALGLSALALMLFGAFASVAAAENPLPQQYTSATTPTILTVKQDGTEGTTTAHQVFTIFNAAGTKSLQITCEGVKAEVTIQGQSQKAAIEAKASYTNAAGENKCAFNGVNVAVNMGDCKYNITPAGKVEVTGTKCAVSEEPINFQGNGCQVKVGRQGVLGGGITWHNEADTPMTVTGEIPSATYAEGITGIQYTQTGIACPESGVQLANGKYTTGNITVTGFKDEAGPKEGAQVSVTVS